MNPGIAIRGTRYPVVLPSLRDPRLHLGAVIVSLQVLGQVAFEFRLSIAQILISIGTCAVLEVVIVLRRQRQLVWPASAILTGNGVAFVLRVPGTEHGDWWSTNGWWIFAATAAVCDLSHADLLTFYELFAANPRTITLFSQGINQSIRGTDQVNAIINLHLATGRIGKPGAAPFSITGQPNAMGGREVGGLASTLAAHMDFAAENVDTVERFWAAPNMATKPGLKAVDLFRAVNEGSHGPLNGDVLDVVRNSEKLAGWLQKLA